MHRRHTILCKPRKTWPPMEGGISMLHEASFEGTDSFKMSFNATYGTAQEQYMLLVQTGAPQALQALLQRYPYHIDSLLQLSEVCNQVRLFA